MFLLVLELVVWSDGWLVGGWCNGGLVGCGYHDLLVGRIVRWSWMGLSLVGGWVCRLIGF